MMFSLSSALLCAVFALVLWGGSGYGLARALGCRGALAAALAPVLGWTVQNALALELARLSGATLFGTLSAVALMGGAWLARRRRMQEAADGPSMPLWVVLFAAAVALAPAAAVVPKVGVEGVALAPAIFDHSKIALVDEIVRSGVPPVNPFYGPPGEPAGVAYYYLWHFAAAQLASLAGAGGWEADAALSWFTAFSTLLLMAGLALRIGGSALAAGIAIAVSCGGALRPVLAWGLGQARLDHLLQPASGLGGWLFQSSWSPHHVAAAGALVVAALLAARLAARPDPLKAMVLGLVVAGAYQSSIWVGGVVLALAMLALAPLLARVARPGDLPRVLVAFAFAVLLAGLLAWPLLAEQYQAGLMRGGGGPIAVAPFAVLGSDIAAGPGGGLLDHLGYWLVLLVVEFPVAYPFGVLALWRLIARGADTPANGEVRVLALLAAVSLACGWLLVSTVGENNDLGWRAVLPGLLVLTAAAGAGLAGFIDRRRIVAAGLAFAAFTASLAGAAGIFAGNVRGEISPDARSFARAPAMWAAVRRAVPIDGRVANNPALFGAMTPWPVNISWALLADRRSCFAGNDLALAFAPLPAPHREAISAQFLRVFAGDGTAEDVHALARTYGCDAILVTAGDGAWARDPFAGSPLYRLVETEPDAWRIYAATPAAPAPPAGAGQ